jgi:hypothetical protein
MHRSTAVHIHIKSMPHTKGPPHFIAIIKNEKHQYPASRIVQSKRPHSLT